MGLLHQTLMVGGTEFGRIPRIYDNDGRDHHNEVIMCLLAGARISGDPTAGDSPGPGDDRPARRPPPKGLPDQTLVVLGAEFGRMLRINDNDGREHDDEAVASLLVGAEMKDGEVDQETDGYARRCWYWAPSSAAHPA